MRVGAAAMAFVGVLVGGARTKALIPIGVEFFQERQQCLLFFR